MDYKVYYSDGTTYAGDPFKAPAMDVQIILHADKEHGRRMVTGADYYVWEFESWYPVDQIGMFCYLIRPGVKRVLIGHMIPNEQYGVIRAAAEADTDFPERTAYHLFERQD